LNKCAELSNNRGTGVYGLKMTAKKKRKRHQIAADKEAEEAKENELIELRAKVIKMEGMMQQFLE
jgi:hypothetical protein